MAAMTSDDTQPDVAERIANEAWALHYGAQGMAADADPADIAADAAQSFDKLVAVIRGVLDELLREHEKLRDEQWIDGKALADQKRELTAAQAEIERLRAKVQKMLDWAYEVEHANSRLVDIKRSYGDAVDHIIAAGKNALRAGDDK